MSSTIKRMMDKAGQALAQRDYEKAGGLFQEVVGKEPENHAAWFGLGEVALGIGQLDTAVQFLEHAVQLAPERVRYLQRLGELYSRIGLVEAGVEVLEQARRRAPDDTGILCSLSGAYVSAGNWHAAKDVLQAAVRRPGVGAPHFCLLGLALQEIGELDAAMTALQKAVTLNPRYPDAWLALGHLHFQKGNIEATETCLEKLFALCPERPTTLNLAGELAMRRGNFREAANFFRAGLRKAADSAELQAKLGLALVQSGDALEAVEAMEKAHAMGVAEDWILEHLGLMFTTRGQLDVARENLEMAVERQPDNLNAWNTLIVVYTKLGESDKARQAAEFILSKDPKHINARLNLGSWYADQARSDEALAQFRKVLEIDPKRMIAYTNSLWALVHSSEAGAQDILDMARAFDRNLCQPLRRADTFMDRDRDPERRLRVGWLTSDMRNHPVAAFVVPFLGCFDTALVENIVYSNSMAADATTELAKARADKWRDVIALGDEALADLIRADAIDILVDLNGNTEGNRLLAVARKPAPIQVTWLGFPGTSGMSAMDYIFIPPDPVLERGQWCTEQPWPLPDCYGVRTMIPDVPIQPGLPCERLGRPFTFACLNNFRKVSQAAIRLWAEILARTPGSRLILVARGGQDGTLVRYIERQFAQHGVAPERLDIRGIMSTHAYFDSYNEADLCLDPFPFNGGTTGYDSIWMGVPFITWPGDMLVSRMGKIILENVGLSELVVESAAAYADLAVALATDRQRLLALRAGLRERMRASPLMDAPRMARALEQAFRGMWRRWCAAAVAAPQG
ncbi:MAG: tetratricopeptide repeat protein [Azovibrio sp.]|nr:tetratricopeptide repeat protein [Azovibrio sp.]